MNAETFESRLCGALMGIFARKLHTIDEIIKGLNETPLRHSDGSEWTADKFQATLRELAKVPPKPTYDFQAQAREFQTIDERRPPNARSNGVALSEEEKVERLLKLGVRQKWYLVASSHEVTTKPLGVTRLGENIVLWRDTSGKVLAVEDRCPHRGIKLSIGAVNNDAIRCAYHGVEVNGFGVVMKVPALANCPLEGRKLLRSYPIIEHYQAIWAYFGNDAELTPPPLDLPDELVSPEWSGILHEDVWQGNYQYVYDNLCDPMHGIYLHGQTYMQSEGLKTDRIKVEEKPQGFEVFREGQKGVNFDWMEFVDLGRSYYVRVEIPLPPTAGPGGSMGIIVYVTPVDENNTRYSVWRLRKVSGWQRDLWHLLFENKLKGFADAVLAQDKMAMSSMPRWPAPENLYQHDVGLVKLRRHFQAVAKTQARDIASLEA